MTKYIDVEKLKAKIEELRKELPNTLEGLSDEQVDFARGQQYELTAIEAEILCLQQEQSDEQPEYSYLSAKYVHGKKPRWSIGDVLAYYICTSNEEGEYTLGKIVNIEFDEDWIYTFEDDNVADEQSLVEDEAYKKN